MPRYPSSRDHSRAVVSVEALATTQPKLKGRMDEVSEVKRKRVRMAADNEDDAYVFRFARAVLDGGECS